jgi:hypothetical protein
MRYAVIHCRNDECGRRVWVPQEKLGTRGRCPTCGTVLSTPTFVPQEELVEGPAVLRELTEAETAVSIGTR